MPTAENEALIRRFNAAMNAHDPDAAAACYVPELANHGRAITRAMMRELLADILRTFPDAHTEIEEMILAGDAVVTRQRTTATHRGTPTRFNVHNMRGIAPTGRPVVMQSIHIWHIEGGLIARHAAMRDDLETMQQIGLWPPAGQGDATR